MVQFNVRVEGAETGKVYSQVRVPVERLNKARLLADFPEDYHNFMKKILEKEVIQEPTFVTSEVIGDDK